MSIEEQNHGDMSKALIACRYAFPRVLEMLDCGNLSSLPFPRLASVWNRYYAREFARFDTLLQATVDNGSTSYAALLPISISHHNLHRLVEVLGHELGDRTVGSTRIPERIQDLVETCDKLNELLCRLTNTATSAPTTT